MHLDLQLLKERYSQDLGAFNSLAVFNNPEFNASDYSHINAINQKAYPEIAKIKNYCAKFMLELVHAEEDASVLATSGSSEAIMLTLSNLKQEYQDECNIIVSESSHISWSHIAKVIGVSLNRVPIGADGKICIDSVANVIDDQTKLVVATLGSPTTLMFDAVSELDLMLNNYNDIGLHVDAAIGGFVAPFIETKPWDFRLDNVMSMNVSVHKYGIVQPGLGYLICRKSLYTSKYNYFGGDSSHESIRFSYGFMPLLQFYFNIMMLGISGYRDIVRGHYDNAYHIHEIMKDYFNLDLPISNHEQLPGLLYENDNNSLYEKLLSKGWNIPKYKKPGTSNQVFRLVFKYGLNIEKLFSFLSDNENDQSKLFQYECNVS
ncbi:MAG: aminotransferase class V-fold PLP-dependent enzyme [Francisellaceae bacterium]|jgi:glutamate decarboxylase|nr:aminotransferase class V-fold PLP-dependent enzyme [Francisellaceae bacterium]